jgi:hypothetical protein
MTGRRKGGRDKKTQKGRATGTKRQWANWKKKKF